MASASFKQTFKDVNSDRVKKFMKHVILASQKEGIKKAEQEYQKGESIAYKHSSEYVLVIDMLMDKVRALEKELILAEEARRRKENENREYINNLSKDMIYLKGKLTNFIEVKNERDKKVEEIERKIRHKVGRNYHEILKIEQELLNLEEIYLSMKRRGIAKKEIEDKMKDMKQRLIIRKAGINPEEIHFVQPSPIEERKPSFLFKKRSIPTGPYKFIKHDMQLTAVREPGQIEHHLAPSAPEPPKELMELPELKRLKKEQRKMSEKKRSFMSKLIGMFKKKPKAMPQGRILPPPIIPAEQLPKTTNATIELPTPPALPQFLEPGIEQPKEQRKLPEPPLFPQ
jgi:hypothetical protein